MTASLPESSPNGDPSSEFPRMLPDGLRLRTATMADHDALATFNARIHAYPAGADPDEGIAAMTRDLFHPDHPTVRPDLFTIVDEPESGTIVSSLCLIPQTWHYAGVSFGVGRPELVGTEPDYRKRGLVRLQMDLVHQWSAARGDLMQVITGIPWYYRQFGYEMAVDLDAYRTYPTDAIATLPADAKEPISLREAYSDDIPFLKELDERGQQRSLLGCLRDEAAWERELHGMETANFARRRFLVIEASEPSESGADSRLGYVALATMDNNEIAIAAVELAPTASWSELIQPILRLVLANTETPKPATRLLLLLEPNHPAVLQLAPRLVNPSRAYSWYVRVPDIPAFLLRIRSVLETRLAASAAANFTGPLQLSFYRGGIQLTFEQGSLTGARHWDGDSFAADGRFPDLTFLQLLLGHRTLAELEYAYTDLGVRKQPARTIVEALFPKQASSVWGIG